MLGVGKWATTGCIAPRVVGHVVAAAHSTDDFYTIDVVLDEFDGAFVTDTGKAVRIEVPPLIGEVTEPGIGEIALPNALMINPANVAIKVAGMPAVGSQIIFSGTVYIDHGSFLEVHPSTPIQAAPPCNQIPAGQPVPLYCNTTLNSFFTWDSGQAPVPMGRGDNRVCFLTAMRGRFQDPVDAIHALLDPVTNNWFLTGTNASGDSLHAEARCLSANSVSAEQTWSQGQPEVTLEGNLTGDEACFLTGVSGHFEGAGESVEIRDVISTGTTGQKAVLSGTSGEAGVGASVRCISNRSLTDFGFVWTQGTAVTPMELVSLFPGCFLTGVAGHFEGAGEQVDITANLFPNGLHWQLGGSSQQSGVQGQSQCVGP